MGVHREKFFPLLLLADPSKIERPCKIPIEDLFHVLAHFVVFVQHQLIAIVALLAGGLDFWGAMARICILHI
jgi:hypothetical protein